jgi:hypothetical protein
MIKLVTKGQIVDLFENTRIEINATHPAFAESAIPGLYTFPFTIPNTAKNQIIYNFPERWDNVNLLNTREPSQLYYNDNLLADGFTFIRPTKSNPYQISFHATGNNLLPIFENKINTFDLGGSIALGGTTSLDDIVAHLKTVALADLGEYPYTIFPYINKGLYGDFNPGGFQGIVNRWGYNSTLLADTFTPLYEYNGLVKFSPLVIFPFLQNVLFEIFKENGFSLETNIFDEEEFQRLVFFNNKTLDKSFDAFLEEYEVIDTIHLKDHLPEITVADFLKLLKQMFGICFFFDQKSKNVTTRTLNEILSDGNYLDATEFTEPFKGYPETDAPDGLRLLYSFDSNDEYSSKINEIDFSLYGIDRGPLPNATSLGFPPISANLNDYALVTNTNQYWIVDTFPGEKSSITIGFKPTIVDGDQFIINAAILGASQTFSFATPDVNNNYFDIDTIKAGESFEGYIQNVIMDTLRRFEILNQAYEISYVGIQSTYYCIQILAKNVGVNYDITFTTSSSSVIDEIGQTLGIDPVKSWRYWFDNLKPDITGNGKEDWSLPISTLSQSPKYVQYSEPELNLSVMLPRVNQKGSSPINDTGKNNIAGAFLFYNGLQLTAWNLTDGIPWGGYWTKNERNTDIREWGLHLSGENSIKETHLQKWFDFLLGSKKFDLKMYPKIQSDLEGIMNFKPIFIQNAHFIIKSYKFILSNESISPVEVEAYKKPY